MKLHEAKVLKMRPTQICVGFLEVEEKIEKLKALSKEALKEFLKDNPLPAVKGPDDHMFIVDHHHLGKALFFLGVEDCYFTVFHDFSSIPKDKFWKVMEVMELCHPHDRDGNKLHYSEIPKSISDLVDDPYRSLAGFVRKAGGYMKVNKPFSEFIWADHFRPHFSESEIQDKTKKTIEKAKALALSPKSIHLPGWIGERK